MSKEDIDFILVLTRRDYHDSFYGFYLDALTADIIAARTLRLDFA